MTEDLRATQDVIDRLDKIIHDGREWQEASTVAIVAEPVPCVPSWNHGSFGAGVLTGAIAMVVATLVVVLILNWRDSV